MPIDTLKRHANSSRILLFRSTLIFHVQLIAFFLWVAL